MVVAGSRFLSSKRLASFSALLLGCSVFCVPASQAQHRSNLQDMVQFLVAMEQQASLRKPPFLYTSTEKSDRTNGHVWTERVADIPQGRLRYLMAVDGHPLPPDRRAEEIARIQSIVANPVSFIRHEKARQNDERHAEEMLDLLPRAFTFEDGGKDGPWIRINYKPNPDYVPQTYEERALHGMSGTLLIDSRSSRLHQLSGRLDDDVKYAYGMLGTIRRGSNFTTTRDMVAHDVWKTTFLDTHIDGRIAILKTMSRTQHSIHQEFYPLPLDITLPQVAALLTR
jgi:hypothetical protein